MLNIPPHIPFDQAAIGQLIAAEGSTLVVRWVNQSGGTADPITGAIVGGMTSPQSGFILAIGTQEAPRYLAVQYQEIEVGDLIIDLTPDPIVTIYPGGVQSGTVPLFDLRELGLRFEWKEKLYSQQELGDRLAEAWSTIIGNTRLVETLLLRRET